MAWPPDWQPQNPPLDGVANSQEDQRSPRSGRFKIISCAFRTTDNGLVRFAEARSQFDQCVEHCGIPRDVIVTDGIRYRMYAGDLGFEPMAYANLVRLKKRATALFARMQRP